METKVAQTKYRQKRSMIYLAFPLFYFPYYLFPSLSSSSFLLKLSKLLFFPLSLSCTVLFSFTNFPLSVTSLSLPSLCYYVSLSFSVFFSDVSLYLSLLLSMFIFISVFFSYFYFIPFLLSLTYHMSKKSWLFLYSELPYKTVQYFLDIQYVPFYSISFCTLKFTLIDSFFFVLYG